MDNRIQGTQGPNPNQLKHVHDSQHAGSVVGQRNGNAVKSQPSISSLVADAMEEMPQNLSETKSKKLAERTARKKSSSRIQEIVDKYVQSVREAVPPEKFHELAESLKNMGKPTPDQIKRQLEEKFKDNQSAALLFLEEALVAEGGHDELLAAVRQVKTELGNELKDFYQNQVKSYEGVSEVYENLLGEYGEQDFMNGIDTLIRRLGNDLQGQGSRMEPAAVKSTVDSLYFLEVAKNTHETFDKLVKKMNTEFNNPMKGDAHQLMKEVLPLKDEKWVDGNKVGSVADRLQLKSIEPRIYFLRELHGIVRRFPEKLFKETEDRQKLATAVQEALDTAIDIEEEQL